MLVTLPFLYWFGDLTSTLRGLLYLFVRFQLGGPRFQAFYCRPLHLIFFHSLSDRRIDCFLLTISGFSNVGFVHWGPTHHVLTPLAVALYSSAFHVRRIYGLNNAVSFFSVPFVGLPSGDYFFLISYRVGMVSGNFVVSMRGVQGSSFFDVRFLTRFRAL